MLRLFPHMLLYIEHKNTVYSVRPVVTLLKLMNGIKLSLVLVVYTKSLRANLINVGLYRFSKLITPTAREAQIKFYQMLGIRNSLSTGLQKIFTS